MSFDTLKKTAEAKASALVAEEKGWIASHKGWLVATAISHVLGWVGYALVRHFL
jgi:hypothetical protein